MTDRIKGLVVTLKDDYRSDDVEILILAISLLQGVAGITTLMADPAGDYVTTNRTMLAVCQDVRKLLAKWMQHGPGSPDKEDA